MNLGIQDIISIGSLIIALFAFLGTFYIYDLSRRRENYQNLQERIAF